MRAWFVRLMCPWLSVGFLAAAITTAGEARTPNGDGHRPSSVVTGAATVVDGDTLNVGQTRIRLEGIDAPEIGQTCGRRWVGTWACGTAARDALEKMVGTSTVSCTVTGQDLYGRALGQCTVAGRDLNAEMVRTGFAWAFVKYSRAYVSVEAEARAARAGIWQGDAEPAWTYRERSWTAAAPAAPSGCAIKGKITKNGQIYHTPWSPWYAVSKVDERRGERWFCTEAEATAAGWRPAGVKW
jgi:endonuclease YncB( thermonuclease family)